MFTCWQKGLACLELTFKPIDFLGSKLFTLLAAMIELIAFQGVKTDADVSAPGHVS
jgi:hypothetical protein